MPQSDGRLLVADAAYSSRVRSAHGFNAHVCAYPLSRPHCRVYIANWISSFPQPPVFFFLQGGGGSGGAAGGLKFTVADTCERIKEEFNFIQQQYHSWVSLLLSTLIFLLAFSFLPFVPVSRAFLFSFSLSLSLSFRFLFVLPCYLEFSRLFKTMGFPLHFPRSFLVRPTFDDYRSIHTIRCMLCALHSYFQGLSVMRFLYI